MAKQHAPGASHPSPSKVGDAAEKSHDQGSSEQSGVPNPKFEQHREPESHRGRESEGEPEEEPEPEARLPSKQDRKPSVDSTHDDEKHSPPGQGHIKPNESEKEDEPDAEPEHESGPAKPKPEEAPSDKPSEEPHHGGPAAILGKRPFILKTLRHEGSKGEGTVTGSILSQTLDRMLATGDRKDAESLTLAALRKLVPHMSRYPLIDKFCTPSGTLIDDETISIIEYLALEDEEETTATTGTPSINIFFRSTRLQDSSGKDGDTSSGETPSSGDGSSVKPRDAPDVETLKKSDPSAELIDSSQFDVSVESSQSGAGKLSETEWATVLRNCAVFYGWVIDPRTRRISRAPKPAFQLRSRVDQEPVAKIPDFVSPSQESDADVGEGIDQALSDQSDRIQKALTPVAEDNTNGDRPASTITPKSNQGIPSFRVNDDSRIEVTAHRDELTVAMARSDFSQQSTEASVSGGAYGVELGVSAGFGTSSSRTNQSLNDSNSSTLVARYMFPRCDLLLWSDELEPTAELAELIDTIHRTKNIKALRRLHADYGNLFCQRVTLGGRLLSTKFVQDVEQQNIEQVKQSFKTSVGASVSGGYGIYSGSVGVKNEHEAGSSQTNESTATSHNEACVFEAVGGETILATNPKAWCPTVANYELWRVINRESLSPLAEILSGMPGLEAVQSWFVQAVPALSRYMTLNGAHECKARLRVMSPTNSLSMHNSGVNTSFYLGHNPSKAVNPRLGGVDTSSHEVYWLRIDVSSDISIFNPATYQAPAIMGYDDFKVGKPESDVLYGSEYNAEFAMTEWDIIAPFDEELMSGTRVILRSCPFKEKDDGKTSTSASHMVVFRNAQGEFLPGMSDSDEYQYWRIMKTDASKRYIKPGDDVRLCWDFRDQTTGWRDFTQDAFGRRQVSAPADVSGPLFLKVPWPRFENTNESTALIMSSDPADLGNKVVNMNNRGTPVAYTYCLQDLRLRIDSVGNRGRGDADDYLLHNVKQDGDKTVVDLSIRPFGYPMEIRKSVFWFGIF
ncbi:hypothetical protein F66182_7405 [Fusarium sp. NRRL 66182]|nr:hypothetical protein F66182_7405 [Fusarium sp. NRRL 66182]